MVRDILLSVFIFLCVCKCEVYTVMKLSYEVYEVILSRDMQGINHLLKFVSYSHTYCAIFQNGLKFI